MGTLNYDPELEYKRQVTGHTKNQIRHIMRDDEREDRVLKGRPSFDATTPPPADINKRTRRNLWDTQEPSYMKTPSPFKMLSPESTPSKVDSARPHAAPLSPSFGAPKAGKATSKVASSWGFRALVWDLMWMLPLALGLFEYSYWHMDLGDALPDRLQYVLGKNKYFLFVHLAALPHLASAYAHFRGRGLLLYLPVLAAYTVALVQPVHSESVSLLLRHMASRDFRALPAAHWQVRAARAAHEALSVVDVSRVEVMGVFNLFRLACVASIVLVSLLAVLVGKPRPATPRRRP
eukprot:CAMPEP_0182876660 /NCGR_PEP_ID=MMETSP0034_2-20130328/14275_1 /TAXON_ID=156128 /ORGANISM="Nephroselmis pyriformis, Strain CCMP717" /LENGTH=291 /DNA_ID=CAMNT_0025009459 /DNA_START=81 /DNA_END=953 /DNA_ORIENTATION=+